MHHSLSPFMQINLRGIGGRGRGRGRVEVVVQEYYHPFSRKLLFFILLTVVVVLGMNLRNKLRQQVHEYEQRRQSCWENYQINDCQHHTDVIEGQCRLWLLCYSIQPVLHLRLLETLASIVGNLLGLVDASILLSSFSVCCVLAYCFARSLKTYTLRLVCHP